jgi:hypothetical protein
MIIFLYEDYYNKNEKTNNRNDPMDPRVRSFSILILHLKYKKCFLTKKILFVKENINNFNPPIVKSGHTKRVYPSEEYTRW